MSLESKQPTMRFTSRVENYVRYRPGYPAAIIGLLEKEIGLKPEWQVADIGSGPGNLSRLFLDYGNAVAGIEPNDAMREAGEILLANYPRFAGIDGTAEATGLPDGSVDLITAGQAFHWFDPVPTRSEFQRILRPDGWVALIWNKRPAGISPMLDDYSAMMHLYAPEYAAVVDHDDDDLENMDILFGAGNYRKFTLPNSQRLDRAGFWGRILSSSYTPLSGQPGHTEIEAGSYQIFDRFAVDGVVDFPYETHIFTGQLHPS